MSDPAQIAHYRSRIEAFRQFPQCTAELLALGEILCDRALEEPEAEKNAGHQVEIQDEIRRLMASLHKARDRGDLDLEAWEEAIRNAVLRYGASLLEGLLTKAGCGRRDTPVLDTGGNCMHSIGVRQKTITTLLGEVIPQTGPACGRGHRSCVRRLERSTSNRLRQSRSEHCLGADPLCEF